MPVLLGVRCDRESQTGKRSHTNLHLIWEGRFWIEGRKLLSTIEPLSTRRFATIWDPTFVLFIFKICFPSMDAQLPASLYWRPRLRAIKSQYKIF